MSKGITWDQRTCIVIFISLEMGIIWCTVYGRTNGSSSSIMIIMAGMATRSKLWMNECHIQQDKRTKARMEWQLALAGAADGPLAACVIATYCGTDWRPPQRLPTGPGKAHMNSATNTKLNSTQLINMLNSCPHTIAPLSCPLSVAQSQSDFQSYKTKAGHWHCKA